MSSEENEHSSGNVAHSANNRKSRDQSDNDYYNQKHSSERADDQRMSLEKNSSRRHSGSKDDRGSSSKADVSGHRHSSHRRHRRSYSNDRLNDDSVRKGGSSSRKHYRHYRSGSRHKSITRHRSSKSPRRSRLASPHSRSGSLHDKNKSRLQESTSHMKSRSRSRDKIEPEQQEETTTAFSNAKRKRRTGWDTAPAPNTAPLPVTPGLLPPMITPTTTGFTATLAGRSAEEAATLAASLQLKATASQLCRIYVGSLDYSLTDQDIRQVFSAFGQITSIDMPKEGTRSKGFCFIEYATPESADLALATMPGFNLKGRAIKVGRPTALGGQSAAALPLTNVVKAGGVNAAEAGQIAAAMLLAKTEGHNIGINPMDDAQNRIYVGSIPPNFTADDIKQIFGVFGRILSCQLIPNSEKPGTHRGYGFIEYSTYDEAKLAIETMNNFQIAGKALKVNHATVMRGSNTALGAVGAMNLTGPTISTASATGVNAIPIQPAQINPLVPNIIPAVIPNIPIATQPAPPRLPVTYPEVLVPGFNTNIVSPILLLSDMVDVSEANDELKDEIKQECSKYGKIQDISITVDIPKNSVRIFVVFSDPQEAAGAVPMLHDRWFGGRKINARLYDQSLFQAGSFWS